MNRLPLFLSTLALLTGGMFAAACVDAAWMPKQAERVPPPTDSPPLPEGRYDLQSIAYDDASDVYRAFLLAPPAGHAPLFVTQQLRMARLSDEDIAAGKKSALAVDPEGPVALLTPDFQISYTHNVVEQHGGEPVVVRQETSSWSPFMSAMTGAMVGNMLFAPRYYYPPPYVGGAPLVGVGGAGTSKALASGDYAQKHGAAPKATVLSKTGYSKAPSAGFKSTGSGAGASRLKGTPTGTPMKRSPFGGSRGFGRRR